MESSKLDNPKIDDNHDIADYQNYDDNEVDLLEPIKITWCYKWLIIIMFVIVMLVLLFMHLMNKSGGLQKQKLANHAGFIL